MTDVKDKGHAANDGPEHDIFDLHPATMFAIFSKLNVNITNCRECGHNELPYFYTADKIERTVPRISSLGLSENSTVTFTPSNHVAVCYLSSRNCGFVRIFNAYPLMEQIKKLGLKVEGNNVHFTR